MKKMIAGFVFLLAAGTFSIASADSLIITEIKSAHSFAGGEDWFEITNVGPNTVNLTGYVYDDGSADFAQGFTFPEIFIGSGESIVVVEALTEQEFHDWWGTNVGDYQVVTGWGQGGNTTGGFGSAGERAHLFDPAQNVVASLSYAAGDTLLSDGSLTVGGHVGVSAGGPSGFLTMLLDPAFGIDSPRYTFAVDGENGAFQSAQGLDVGSPGFSGVAAIPEPTSLALLGLGSIGLLLRRRR